VIRRGGCFNPFGSFFFRVCLAKNGSLSGSAMVKSIFAVSSLLYVAGKGKAVGGKTGNGSDEPE
jgi:hypothetical protein